MSFHMVIYPYEFEWDPAKDAENQSKHGISFYSATIAFFDDKRSVYEDVTHSSEREKRFFCVGRAGLGIVTVRFTFRADRIRIIGAGFWRRGRRLYEEKNRLHKST